MGVGIRLALLVPLLVSAGGSGGDRAPVALEEVVIELTAGQASEFSYAPGADRVAYRLDWAEGRVGLWVCDRPKEQHFHVVPEVADERVHVLALSPDGGHLAYMRTSAEAPPRLLGVGVVGIESGRKLELPGTAAAWTGKGDRLAVADPSGGVISVVEVPSMETRIVTKTPRAGDPYEQPCLAWSPDGSRLAYTISEPEGPMTSIWVVPAEGGDARLAVTDGEGCASLVPFWSPDGRLAWRLTNVDDPAGTRHYVQEADAQVRELGKGVPLNLAGGPSWRPDGSAIVFARTVEPTESTGVSTTDLWELDVASGELRRLTDAGDASGEVVWSPTGGMVWLTDGRRLRSARLGAR